MNDEGGFELADPDGVFLTLSRHEAQAMYADLRDDEDLSENLRSLRDQLAEFVEAS